MQVHSTKLSFSNTSWTDNRPQNILFWLGSPLLFAFIWGASCGIFLGRNRYAEDLLISDILPNHYQNLSINDIGLVSVYFYPKLKNGMEVINWSSFIGMGFTTTILLTTESLMLFSGLKCYLAIQALISQSAHSKAFRQMQSQLFFALVSQTIIPIVFMQLPVSALYASIFFNSSHEFFGILLSLTISLYLATDALPTILIIKEFRVTVLRGYHNQKSEETQISRMFKMCKVQHKMYFITEAECSWNQEWSGVDYSS